MTFSKIFVKHVNLDIGRLLFTSSLSPFLNKEITLDSFHFSRKIPRVIAEFINVESTGLSTEEESLIK